MKIQVIRNKIEGHRENWVNHVNQKDLQTVKDLEKDGITFRRNKLDCLHHEEKKKIPAFSGIGKIRDLSERKYITRFDRF